MRRNVLRLLGLLCLSVLLMASKTQAMKLTHQGLLTDAGGSPLTGSFTLTFNIYATPSGPTSLWTEAQTVSVANGLFSVELGAVTAFPAGLFSSNPQLFLGIQVDADPEIAPRTELNSSAYAFHSSSVEGFSTGPGNVDNGLFSIVGGDNNTNQSDYSTILGGHDNEVNVTEFADTTFDTTGLAPPTGGFGAFAVHPPGMGTILGGHFNTVCGNHAVIVQGYLNYNCAAYSFIGTGYQNRIEAIFSFIGTGLRNRVTPTGHYSVIGGGAFNTSNGFTAVIGGGAFNTTTANFRGQTIGGGWRNNTDNNYSTVGGGEGNYALFTHSTIGGGQFDSTGGAHATVGGGLRNYAVGPETFVGGGSGNRAEGQASTIGGGEGNTTNLHEFQFIGGGQGNRANGPLSTIGGGQSNETVTWATVGGGVLNKAFNEYTFIGGGNDNVANGHAAVIGGGLGNLSSGWASTVGGGEVNGAFGAQSFIGGGFQNAIQADTGVIGGGAGNVVTGISGVIGGGSKNNVLGDLGFIGGGSANSISGRTNVIGGGEGNITGALSGFSVIPGGFENLVLSQNSYAAGTRAHAANNCSYVWSDCCIPGGAATSIPFTSFIDNSYNARAVNGFYFLTSCDTVFDPASGIGSGVYVPPGGSMWMSGSSRTIKKNITPVDGSEILEKVEEMPLYRWSYKGQSDEVAHIGPMAEDFYETFNIGDNNTSIGVMDPAGVSLAAAKELIKENKELKDRLARLESLVDKLLTDKSDD